MPHSWEQLEKLFHEVLALPAHERRAFLEQRCGDNPELIQDVESLLEYQNQPTKRVGAGVSAAAAALLAEAPPGELALDFGPYRINRKLGEGGMGCVYHATDTRLGRDVAIKLLSKPLANKPLARARFLREAKSAAALAHPNIAALHDFSADGDVPWLVMEYVPGVSLRTKLLAGPMSEAEVLSCAFQVADALEHSHARRIIHRDVKPENIIIRDDGIAKLVDFGLARILSNDVTEHSDTASITLAGPATVTGSVVGTASYMSPEQAEGGPVDFRCDIFSFGVVLYEMITGRRAFDGKTPISILAKVLRDEPPTFSGDLHAIVSRCMRKDPSQRFESFVAVRAALKDRKSSIQEFTLPPKETASIAVLPFLDLSPLKDQEYLCDGLAEEILNSLTSLRNVRVAARTSAFSFRGRGDDVRQIGRLLNVGFVLQGSVRTSGNRLRVTTQLVDTASGHQIWSERYDRELGDVFAVQDEIAESVVTALRSHAMVESGWNVSRRYTENLEAYTLYLRGRHALNRWTPDGYLEAKQCFEAAIEKDRSYSLAWAGLADTLTVQISFGYANPSESFPAAQRAARRALEIDPELAEAHVSAGAVEALFEWDWKRAARSFHEAAVRSPGNSTSYHALAIACLAPQRRFREAVAAIERARALDPYSLPVARSAATIAILAGDLDSATALEADMERMAPGHPGVLAIRSGRYIASGRYEEAFATAEQFDKIIPGHPFYTALRAFLLARMGNDTEARVQFSKLEQAPKGKVQNYDLAWSLAALGRTEEAFTRLEQAAESHDSGLVYCASDAKLTDLHGHARFTALLERMNLASAAS